MQNLVRQQLFKCKYNDYMKRILQFLNLLTLLFTIGVNYFFNAGHHGSASVKEISARYDTLLTPSGYAFGIWGLVYLGLIIFAVYQLWDLFKKNLDTGFVLKIGWWFIIANLANAAWIFAFTTNQIGLSLILIFLIFFALLKIMLNTNMERWDAPVPVIAFIWWPFSLYFGWINIALIVNVAAYLTAIGWNGGPLSPELWAILMLLVAAVIFITMTWTRNMREYANVGVWGIVAIAVKNWNSHAAVAWVALAVAIVIFINASVHGYRNRATAPFAKRVNPI